MFTKNEIRQMIREATEPQTKAPGASFDQTLAQIEKLLQQVQTVQDSWRVYKVWNAAHENVKEMEGKAKRKAGTVGGQITAALKNAMENGKVPAKSILTALDKKQPGAGNEVRRLAQEIQASIQDQDRNVEKYGKKAADGGLKKAQRAIQKIIAAL